ncbi:DUF3006 domain-containing protein [Paludicola sp. MB14-C6]|uniref:DUF3006 domain-containing protein n=1 Tax=Paludihabitans sp. MB14-C6 TaxID=3070656 RepID=UPI0027DD4673|nr:DUF3006 domain-containing protein [Paludicola sp. MB14-C6]WMJ23288.1 DUF3006 domain-containing protein [Paludicola sp. MB14-C6]
MKEYLVVDRIEDNNAICEKEDRTFVTIPLFELYATLKEGDWILFENGKYSFDSIKTKEARNKNILLQNSLFED